MGKLWQKTLIYNRFSFILFSFKIVCKYEIILLLLLSYLTVSSFHSVLLTKIETVYETSTLIVYYIFRAYI